MKANNENSLENIVKAQGALFSSDLHGNYDLISSGLKHANDNDLVYVVNGDVVNDYAFKEMAHNLDIYSPNDIQLQYLEKNLSQKDLETLINSQNASQYGIDAMLSQIPKEHRTEAKKSLEDALKYSQSELFQKRIEKISQNMLYEKADEIQESALKLRALYEVFMDEEAKRFAEELNKYSNVKVLFNKGNHENVYFVEQISQYLNNKDQIVDLSALNEIYTIKDSNGNETTIAGITNCSNQFMSYLSEIFAPKELDQLYSHTFQEKNNLVGKSAEILVTHGQIGKPAGITNPREVPYLDSAKKLGLESKLIVEGHIHNKFEGENEFGDYMIRSAGENVAIVTKDNRGNLKTDWVKIGEDYNGGHHNKIPYDNDYLLLRVEDMLKQYELIMSQTANDNSNSSESDDSIAA